MQTSSFYDKVVQCATSATLSDTNPSLNAVTIKFDKKSLLLRGYFNANATDGDIDDLDHALTVIAAELWQEIDEFYFEAVSVESHFEMEKLMTWIYIKPGLSLNIA